MTTCYKITWNIIFNRNRVKNDIIDTILHIVYQVYDMITRNYIITQEYRVFWRNFDSRPLMYRRIENIPKIICKLMDFIKKISYDRPLDFPQIHLYYYSGTINQFETVNTKSNKLSLKKLLHCFQTTCFVDNF